MKRILTIAIVIAMLAVIVSSIPVFAAEPKSYEAKYGEVTVDGEISEGEWDGVSFESLDIFLPKDAGVAVKVDNVKTRSFGTVEFAAMHDDDTLYLLVEVIDDQIVTYKDYKNSGLADIKTTYRFDVLFIGIGQYGVTQLADNASVFVAYPYNDISDYSGYAVRNDEKGIYTNGITTMDKLEECNEEGTVVRRRGNYDPTNIDYSCKTSSVTVDETAATKCVMEFAIPLADLGITDAEQIALDLSYHDTRYDNGTTVVNSNRRENILAWSAVGANTNDGKGVGDTGNTCNIDQWGTVTLAEEVIETPEEPVVPPVTPDEPSDPVAPPATGDMALCIALVAVATLIASALLITKRTRA